MRKDEKSNSPTTKTPTKAVSSKRELVLTLLVLAQFMVIVDFMIVQVALPSIGKEFGISINGTAMDSHRLWFDFGWLSYA